MGMTDSQQYPWNLYLIKISINFNLSIFLGLKVFNSENSIMFSWSRNSQATLVEKKQLNMKFD